ncbi:hypothetical protein BDZ94DRAFT_1246280 [Collybia nuda]|uniref:Uncharacterized protein n=1 Tax=Collybia nuda TaxID=64659 RepID=A0A9P6CJ13_9AGAR|nr:hypothetical protein BDZ94DRAFT_1246280 [Collybia nuda]
MSSNKIVRRMRIKILGTTTIPYRLGWVGGIIITTLVLVCGKIRLYPSGNPASAHMALSLASVGSTMQQPRPNG